LTKHALTGAHRFCSRCSLRCIYHGWRVDGTGRVVEVPSEGSRSASFAARVRINNYNTYEGGGLFCTHCGFPAQISAFELERAKQLGSVEAFLAERQVRHENWRRKPPPKKMLIVAATPLMFGGVIVFQLAWDWRNMAGRRGNGRITVAIMVC
jgi:hypothetical protein